MTKFIIIGIIVVLLVAVGIIVCSISKTGTEYVETVVSKPDEVLIQMAGIEANHKINLFKVTQGRLPESIAEVEKSQGALKKLPRGKKYEYNPVTGEISIVDGKPKEK